MKAIYLLVLIFASISSASFAQTACPGGVAAGSAQCGPSPADHGVNSAPATPEIRYVLTGKWIPTWGAIASGSHNTSEIGVTVGKFSRNEAKEEAIDRCESASGGSCELTLAYFNSVPRLHGLPSKERQWPVFRTSPRAQITKRFPRAPLLPA